MASVGLSLEPQTVEVRLMQDADHFNFSSPALSIVCSVPGILGENRKPVSGERIRHRSHP